MSDSDAKRKYNAKVLVKKAHQEVNTKRSKVK